MLIFTNADRNEMKNLPLKKKWKMSVEHVPRWFANTTVHFECLQLYCFKTKDVKDIVNFCSVRLCSDDVCSSAYVFLLSTKQITRNSEETYKNDLASASVSITRGWLVFVLQWVICSTKVPLKFRFGTTNNRESIKRAELDDMRIQLFVFRCVQNDDLSLRNAQSCFHFVVG